MAFDVISRIFRWLGQPPAADQPEAIDTATRADTAAPQPGAPEAIETAAAGTEPPPIAGEAAQPEGTQVETAEEESKVVEMRPTRRARRGKRRGRAA